MTGPCKRAGSRFWWYRKGTPTDILTRKNELAALGINVPTQVWRSLKTENRKAAELAYAEVSADVERRWEHWRKMLATGPVTPTNVEVSALAGHDARTYLRKHKAEPSEAPLPRKLLGAVYENVRFHHAARSLKDGQAVFELGQALLALPAYLLPERLAGLLKEEPEGPRKDLAHAFAGALLQYRETLGWVRAPKLAEEAGLALTKEGRTKLAKMVAAHREEIWEALRAYHRGDYRPRWLEEERAVPEFSPPAAIANASAVSPSDLSFQDLLDRWAEVHTRANKAAATLKRYPPAWFSLKEFVEHDRPLDIAISDLRGWREWLLTEKELSPSTVRKVHVTAIKTIFSRAKDDGHIEVNPATDLLPPAYSQKKTRAPHFTDDEAEAILKAALAVYQSPGKRAPFTLRALRWVPWICAYTGSRVSEITQLRTSDIERTRLHGAFFVLTPDAGTIKTGVFRRVPVHAHLVEQGFLEMVDKLPSGPIFYNPKRTSAAPWAEAGGDVAKFVRTVAGVADPRIQPNHAWRHHFKTHCRQTGIETFWQDTFTGHAHRSEGDKYGGVTDDALRREMDKLPRIEFEED